MFETPRYRVTGTQPVLGHQPGTEFEADLDPGREALFLAGGHLTRLDAAPAPDERDEPDPDTDQVAEPETPQSAAEQGEN